MDCSFPITKGWTLIPEPLFWLLNWADFKLGQEAGVSDHASYAASRAEPGHRFIASLQQGLDSLIKQGLAKSRILSD